MEDRGILGRKNGASEAGGKTAANNTPLHGRVLGMTSVPPPQGASGMSRPLGWGLQALPWDLNPKGERDDPLRSRGWVDGVGDRNRTWVPGGMAAAVAGHTSIP